MDRNTTILHIIKGLIFPESTYNFIQIKIPKAFLKGSNSANYMVHKEKYVTGELFTQGLMQY